MLKVIGLTILQCLMLASGQVFFKLAVGTIGRFQWAWRYIFGLLANGWLWASALSLIAATVLWGMILKHFAFSVAYPVTAFAYIFGMLAAIFIFHETVSLSRWIGVGLIIAGVFFIAK